MNSSSAYGCWPVGLAPVWFQETCNNPDDVRLSTRFRNFLISVMMNDDDHHHSAWNGRPWPGRSQNWMLMYFIINLSGSQQFSGSSIQNQVELSEWATGRFMHCHHHHQLTNVLLPAFHILIHTNRIEEMNIYQNLTSLSFVIRVFFIYWFIYYCISISPSTYTIDLNTITIYDLWFR